MSTRVKTYNSPLREEQARRTRERILERRPRDVPRAGLRRDHARGHRQSGGGRRADRPRDVQDQAQPRRAPAQARRPRRRRPSPSSRTARPSKQCSPRPTPTRSLDRLADLAAALHSRSWDVMEIARGAAISDPAIAELYEQRPRARHTNQRAVAKRLARTRRAPATTPASRPPPTCSGSTPRPRSTACSSSNANGHPTDTAPGSAPQSPAS